MRGSHGAGPQLADKTLINPIRKAPGLAPRLPECIKSCLYSGPQFSTPSNMMNLIFLEKFQESKIRVGDPLVVGHYSVCLSASK